MLNVKRKTLAGGYSLIEVLVAMVVLSLAVLGFAALQITGLTSNKIAMGRSQASMLAYTITDAMRANRTKAISNAYDRALDDATPSSSSTEQADLDLNEWLTNLANALPSGKGSISVDTSTNVATVVVQWNENKDASNPSQFSISTRL